MDKIHYLLMCLMEECGEISQAAGKVGRFGISSKPPNGGLPNNEYLVLEINDFLGVLELLKEEGVDLSGIGNREAIEMKKKKLLHFMELSKNLGIVTS